MSPLKTVLFALAFLAPAVTRADSRPRWELGVGLVGLRLPDYRGSAESRNYIYPLPYFLYRGDVLRVDRQGARATFVEIGRARLDFSVDATPPVRSGDDHTRQGMPGLDPTIEFGPMLRWSLTGDAPGERHLELQLPLRAVVATNLLHAHAAGFVLNPRLNASVRLAGWNTSPQAGPLFATGQYHRYFYGVDAVYAAPGRPAYVASGGYSGFAALAAVSRRIGRLWIGAFFRYDALRGAVFEASPLVRRDSSLMAGAAIAWIFATSQERVASDR